MFKSFIELVRDIYNTSDYIPLHEPTFIGNERKYVLEALDSTFVSSIGEFVNNFENYVAEYTGNNFAIATVNGTAALHVALKLAGVENKDQVITQSLSFVATSNAIHYCNAEPIFIDVNKATLSLCPEKLEEYLDQNCEVREDGFCWSINSNKRVMACLPMHTFGFPASLNRIKKICDEYNISLVEDAAESLGSFYKEKHTGTSGSLSIFSFNGNKIITTGGGGMIVTDDEEIAIKAKHITTTSKVIEKWKWSHDEIGFNYRLPNINAAIGLAQMEMLDRFLESKRKIASVYSDWFRDTDTSMYFFQERNETKANYWLNTIIAEDRKLRDIFLEETNSNKINTRACWQPMNQLAFNKNAASSDLSNTEWLYDRLINIPSSPII